MREWFVLRVKPRQEAIAAMHLHRAGLDVYLPETKVHRRHGAAPSAEPLFPGYLFSRLDASRGEIRLATYTSGVARVLGYGDSPTPVPDSLVAAIRLRVAMENGLNPRSLFRRGERVIVSHGPLRDVEAVFDRQLSASGRVRVLIGLLGRLCPTEVMVGQLQKAG